MASLDDLAALLHAEGPFLTVYLATPGALAQAQDTIDLRWKNLRKQAAASGAPEAVLAAADPLVDGAHLEGATLAVVATEQGGVLYQAHEPDPPGRDIARWSMLPYVAPLIEWRQSMPAHVVVLTDRIGADIHVFFREQPGVHLEVEGETAHITRSHPGGWSQKRFQQTAENLWEENAADVAARLAEVVAEVDPRLVVAAGDVRALQFMEEHLPGRVLDRLTVIDGGRAVDGGVDAVAEDVVKLVASAVAEDTVALLESFREERGQHDRAADGVAATVAALNRAQVETLLVHDDPDDERTIWFGSEAVPVGLEPADLDDLGVAFPEKGRLVDGLIRAALGTGAAVRIIPTTGANGPADGVGAILRYA